MAEENKFKRPSLHNHPKALISRLLRGWTLLVWLAACILAVCLYSTSFQFGEMIGVVETIAEPVAPLETARLLSLGVMIGHRVKAGDVVAKMDTSLLDARMAVDEAKIVEAEETIAGYQQSMLQLVRQGEMTIKDAEAALEVCKIQQVRDTAELEELTKEQKRRDDLLAKKLISEVEASVLRPQIAAMEHAIAASPALIKVQERRLEEVNKEKEDMKVWLRVGKDDDISKVISHKMETRNAVFGSSRELRKIRREECNLKAVRGGVVSMIMQKPGDVVQAGQPILRLVSEKSDTVVGFLPEIHLADLKAGQKTVVWRTTGRGIKINATVESIAPEVMALPARVSPIRGQPLRGRRVILKLEGVHDFIPGETVQISNAESSWANLKKQLSFFFSR